MRNYRPILLSDLGISLPSVEVLRVCLNRHLPEADWIREHAHADHCQFLLYLTGRGWQAIEGEDLRVSAGKLIFLAPGVSHAFRKEQARRPLCLVVDLKLEEGVERCARESQLTSGEMAGVRRILSRLIRGRQLELRSGALILELVHRLLTAAKWRKTPERGRAMPMTRLVNKVLRGKDGCLLTPREIADRAGYQQDHLNRALKRECGATTGQMLAAARLDKAKALLGSAMKIGDVAEKAGFPDQNYFARWFKSQTGMTPSAWRAGNL